MFGQEGAADELANSSQKPPSKLEMIKGESIGKMQGFQNLYKSEDTLKYEYENAPCLLPGNLT
jgi:hypothetical protein